MSFNNYTTYLGSKRCCNRSDNQYSQGAQGSFGAQGSQGATGSKGINGAQGSEGAQGPRGYLGPRGSQGEQGATGAQGNTGIQGATGSQGNTGIMGAQGATGIAGASTYPGANYRDLITFAFTQNNGTVGASIAQNKYAPVIIFSQPTTVSIAYISFTFSNTAGTDLTIDRLYLYDLTSCTNYNFTAFDGTQNGATVIFDNGTSITSMTAATQNQVKVFPYIISPVISPTASPKPCGIVIKITGASGACQLMSIVIGYQ